MICTLIEKSNNSREILYSKEEIKPSFWIRKWQYIDLPTEKIKEIQEVSTDKVQEILKSL